ncbi:hypothetical protein MNV49_005837 [Pseudohyphozyma bogoriensis]|nr:hypothetical protein MNV49_005837 [Pseudohyphozyma bogoriensis]
MASSSATPFPQPQSSYSPQEYLHQYFVALHVEELLEKHIAATWPDAAEAKTNLRDRRFWSKPGRNHQGTLTVSLRLAYGRSIPSWDNLETRLQVSTAKWTREQGMSTSSRCLQGGLAGPISDWRGSMELTWAPRTLPVTLFPRGFAPGKDKVPALRAGESVTGYDAQGRGCVTMDSSVNMEVKGPLKQKGIVWTTEELIPDVQSGKDMALAELPGVIHPRPTETVDLHYTTSLDYMFIVQGEIMMELDDGSTTLLKAGDSVVMNGTIHAWHNRGDTWARMLAINMPAKPVTIDGKPLDPARHRA